MKNTNNLTVLTKEFYLNILENLFLCVFVNDKSGKTLYTNPAIIRYYGSTADYLIRTHSEWGFWEGIVFPPAYKQLMKEKRTVYYNQLNIITNKCYPTINTPVMKENQPNDVEFMVQIIQENFLAKDLLENKTEIKKEFNSKVDLIGKDQKFCELINDLEKVTNSDMPILLLGESGTGKTHIAQHIHNTSYRYKRPFHSVNCGAIPSQLLESELFGYVPGAFTGANTKGKKGLFELAEGGTLFLDEIGDMPIELQVKILHVLEDGKFMPVGSSVLLQSNVRIISATNKDLKKCIKNKTFREDLYWRINAYSTVIPSLCKRKEDIIPLAEYYLNIHNKKYNTTKVFYPQTLILLTLYHWPGNVRELKNTIERIYILTKGKIIYENHIPKEIMNRSQQARKHYYRYYDIVKQAEKEIIMRAYHFHQTISGVAQGLEISESRANRLVSRYSKLRKEDSE